MTSVINYEVFGHYAEVTKSDTVAFTDGACDALYVGAGGTATIVREDGTAVSFVGLAAGSIIPIKAIRVNDTGTAASFVALYRRI